MKTITANRLTDGRVVYLTPEKSWTENADLAVRLEDDATDAALETALRDVLTVVGPYPIDIDAEAEGFSPAGRKHVRETIRLSGPSAGSTKLASSTGGAHV
ncbi:MAG: hypothetical protein CMH91_11810 [Oceanicaulis sp.]|uniref:DUF2849 domain-containing protein n=1 Tax=unclassified Oceanicaulis TaxID=2632123 RepID=UPI000C501F03|nr:MULTISPECIES: DUF2849 domain-containing protein [unclassified Oceanicaulis]MAB70635.1 hypothetical protein [Oceanicaulis sp.]MBC39729.1 hypothetical protein [Oceanicaulis sp.]MBG35784.1 hypothetical protein [Oceanicaulis sp.]HBU63862.1 DUF2849 domain-containing protein [Oceanicaulis sp.]|tara:strand:- start:489 stop:791 length:303 start_codon:yes stop_codon:yes gene_type:complete